MANKDVLRSDDLIVRNAVIEMAEMHESQEADRPHLLFLVLRDETGCPLNVNVEVAGLTSPSGELQFALHRDPKRLKGWIVRVARDPRQGRTRNVLGVGHIIHNNWFNVWRYSNDVEIEGGLLNIPNGRDGIFNMIVSQTRIEKRLSELRFIVNLNESGFTTNFQLSFDPLHNWAVGEAQLRLLELFEVESTDDLKGKLVRSVKDDPAKSGPKDSAKIGHILKDKWFDKEEFGEKVHRVHKADALVSVALMAISDFTSAGTDSGRYPARSADEIASLTEVGEQFPLVPALLRKLRLIETLCARADKFASRKLNVRQSVREIFARMRQEQPVIVLPQDAELGTPGPRQDLDAERDAVLAEILAELDEIGSQSLELVQTTRADQLDPVVAEAIANRRPRNQD